jgi:hypothetical protein
MLRNRLSVVRSAKFRLSGVVVVVLALAATFAGASPAMAATVVPLGTLDGFNVLAATTVTSTGATVINDGDLGLYSGSAVVGFPAGVINNGVQHVADAQALQAQSDWTTAFNQAASQGPPTQTGLLDLATHTYTAGIYDGGVISNTGTVTLSGSSTDVFIFRASSALTIGNASTVLLTGGATQCNVFWTVDGSATIGTTANFKGTLLARASISAATGATIGGRLLASTGAVTLQGNTINRDVADCGARPAIVASTPLAAAAPSAPVSGSGARRGLPMTGVDPLPLAIPAALVVLVGTAFVIFGARRKRRAA